MRGAEKKSVPNGSNVSQRTLVPPPPVLAMLPRPPALTVLPWEPRVPLPAVLPLVLSDIFSSLFSSFLPQYSANAMNPNR